MTPQETIIKMQVSASDGFEKSNHEFVEITDKILICEKCLYVSVAGVPDVPCGCDEEETL